MPPGGVYKKKKFFIFDIVSHGKLVVTTQKFTSLWSDPRTASEADFAK